MERKRGKFSNNAGEIKKESRSINELSEEKSKIEVGMETTYTRLCTSFLTLFCCS